MMMIAIIHNLFVAEGHLTLCYPIRIAYNDNSWILKKYMYNWSPDEFLQHNIIYLILTHWLMPASLALRESTDELIKNTELWVSH